jgi:hypothetical protein
MVLKYFTLIKWVLSLKLHWVNWNIINKRCILFLYRGSNRKRILIVCTEMGCVVPSTPTKVEVNSRIKQVGLWKIIKKMILYYYYYIYVRKSPVETTGWNIGGSPSTWGNENATNYEQSQPH